MENKIIELYLSGFGSTTIVKKLSIPKRKVLKILNDNNLINKLEPKEYENFKFENDVWYDYYTVRENEHKSHTFLNSKITKLL